MSEASNKPPLPADTLLPEPPAQSGPAAADQGDGRQDFEVTELAGPRVAGRRVEGKVIRLTDEEAFAELQSGTIVRKGEKLHDMFKRKGAAKKA